MCDIDTQLGRIFNEALLAELAGEQALSRVWRRLLFAMARDLCGLRVVSRVKLAEAEPPSPRAVLLADELLEGLRCAIREPHNAPAQILPRNWTLRRTFDAGLRCTFVVLVSPDGKPGRIVGVDTDVVTDIAEIRLAIREAGKYNIPIKPSSSRKKKPVHSSVQLALAGV